jgi:membrane-associated phospholipid phosphatase
LILAIGFSRIYLGVHYLSDVMAGFLGGGAWVLACITADTVVRNSIARRG